MNRILGWIAQFVGVGVALALLVLLYAIAPLLTLWSLNTLSEQAQWGWYIPHNVWTYLAIFYLLIIRGSGVSSKSATETKKTKV